MDEESEEVLAHSAELHRLFDQRVRGLRLLHRMRTQARGQDPAIEIDIWLSDFEASADTWLAEAVFALAQESGNADLFRLSLLLLVITHGTIASHRGHGLPDKPGMASGYALSTIFAEQWAMSSDGSWSPKPRRRPIGHDPDPVGAGKTWRKRLLRKLHARQKEGLESTLDALMLLIMNDFIPLRVKVTDPPISA